MKFAKILLLSSLLFLALPVLASTSSLHPNLHSDTIKYRGYRLELTNFKLVKAKSDWLKVSCIAINSGRNDIDLGKTETAHWVLINFDQSIFSEKLGGYRDNIKQQLINDKFSLTAGSTEEIELKIPVIIPPSLAKEDPNIDHQNPTNKPEDLTWQSSQLPTLPVKTIDKPTENACPDILITEVKILEEDDKWATVEYTFTNQGDGTFYLFGKTDSKNDNLVVNAFISGVTDLTRGAIPIGGQIFTEKEGMANELLKGDTITAQLKLDIRKKTRYMKSLILSLDSYQFADECDRINNHMGVVLR